MSRQWREGARALEPDLLGFLQDIVRIPSLSSDEGAVIRRIREEMERLGYDEVRTDPMGNLLGRIGDGPRVIALDGLSLATAELDLEGNRHDKGWVHAWTGNNADFTSSDTRSTSPSLDQLVAGHIARTDRLPSLELSIEGGLEPARAVSYGANGQPLPRLTTADAAWQRMFGPSLGDGDLATRQRNSSSVTSSSGFIRAPRKTSPERTILPPSLACMWASMSFALVSTCSDQGALEFRLLSY